MKSVFDKLNLRPQERRLVVIVGLVVFVLLNMWFVWPYFGDWGRLQGDLQKNRSTLERYQREIARRAQYEREEKNLETTGSEMLNSELDFQRIISSNAVANSVQVSSLTPGKQLMGGKTNQFFQEGSINVAFTSGGKEIVDFLVAIAAQNSMIRVREMSLRPADAGQTKLAGTLVFVGNYARPQTNAAAGNARAGSTPGAARPVANAGAKTNAPAKPAKAPPSAVPRKNT